jgi:hypothetical protein
MGSMLDLITRALYNKYSIVILNPNNFYHTNIKVEGNSTPEEHLQFVWDNYITKTKSKEIHIMAHFTSSKWLYSLINKRGDSCMKRITKIGIIDSYKPTIEKTKVKEWMKSVTECWEPSVDTFEKEIIHPGGFKKYSTGTMDTMQSIRRSIDHIFDFFMGVPKKIKEDENERPKKKKKVEPIKFEINI